jgi:nucleoid-associated protein YejK
MQLTKEKRKEITDLVMGVVTRLDTGKRLNTERFSKLLQNMSDEQFDAWASKMGYELDDTI